MSYTYPTGQPQGEPVQFTNVLREIIIAEIVAINGYQQHIADSSMDDVNKVWRSIMLDEKKHYGLLLALLRKYDPAEEAAVSHFGRGCRAPNLPCRNISPSSAVISFSTLCGRTSRRDGGSDTL